MSQVKEGKKRRYFTAEEKVKAVKRVLRGKEEISTVCEELGVQPSLLYQWTEILFARGAAVFEREDRREQAGQLERIRALEAKLQRKDNVLGELMEEHVMLKKTLGEA
jgi:transposase-like protein